MSNLPTKWKPPTLAELENPETYELKLKENKLMVLLNQPPPAKFIKDNKGVKYLPIEVVKYFLNYIYGSYQVEVLREGVMANSVYCAVRLTVTNPVTGQKESNEGYGAVPIQLDKDSIPTDFTKIKADAIQKNLPAAKSFAVSNAAGEFGLIFGRNLQNKDGLDYTNLAKEDIKVEYLQERFELCKGALTEKELKDAERIIGNKEVHSYSKLNKLFQETIEKMQ